MKGTSGPQTIVTPITLESASRETVFLNQTDEEIICCRNSHDFRSFAAKNHANFFFKF